MMERLRIPERLVQLGPNVIDADIQTLLLHDGIRIIFDVTTLRDKVESKFQSAFTIAKYTEDAVGIAIEQAMGEFQEVVVI